MVPRNGSTLVLAGLLGLGLTHPAHAEEAEESLQLGGLIYGHWGADLNEMTKEFDLDRVYLTARRNLGESFAVRVTTDVGREKAQTINVPYMGSTLPIPVPENTRTRVFLKYGYLEWKEALPGVKVRLGMASTPWIAQHERFWGHRWVQQSFADRSGVLNSSDLGVHAMGSTWPAISKPSTRSATRFGKAVVSGACSRAHTASTSGTTSAAEDMRDTISHTRPK